MCCETPQTHQPPPPLLASWILSMQMNLPLLVRLPPLLLVLREYLFSARSRFLPTAQENRLSAREPLCLRSVETFGHALLLTSINKKDFIRSNGSLEITHGALASVCVSDPLPKKPARPRGPSNFISANGFLRGSIPTNLTCTSSPTSRLLHTAESS